jgi:DNA-directed RNA polymerase alpha subunit
MSIGKVVAPLLPKEPEEAAEFLRKLAEEHRIPLYAHVRGVPMVAHLGWPAELILDVYEITKDVAAAESVASRGINTLDLPFQIEEALARGGFDTVGELLEAPDEELLALDGIKSGRLAAIRRKLKREGFATPIKIKAPPKVE